MTNTLRNNLHSAITQLTESPTATLDAEILLAHVLDKPRSYLLTWPETPLTATQQNEYNALITRRAAGEPIAYLTGWKEFWSLPFQVSKDTLIPRPETELLVETVLNIFDINETITILDLGTGTGCIAIALAHERPQAQLLACDISERALDIARKNATNLRIKNIRFMQSDWFSNIPPTPFDIIVSNPPYIAEQNAYLQQGDIRFEPQTALSSGINGLDAIQKIIDNAKTYLKPDAYLVFEIGYDQANAVTALLTQKGFANIRCLPDLAGHMRVCIAQTFPAENTRQN